MLYLSALEREWPFVETRYLINWIQMVHIVKRLNVPTHDFVAMTLANKPMTRARLIKLLSR